MVRAGFVEAYHFFQRLFPFDSDVEDSVCEGTSEVRLWGVSYL